MPPNSHPRSSPGWKSQPTSSGILPNEILFKIFKHLGYWDLRMNIPYVCPLFAALLASAPREFDEILFCDKPDPVIAALQLAMREDRGSDSDWEPPPAYIQNDHEYKVHPAFRLISYKLGMRLHDIAIQYYEKGVPDQCRVWESSICTENAVTPAVSNLVVRIRVHHGTEIHRHFGVRLRHRQGNGVTVLDVMKAVARIILRTKPDQHWYKERPGQWLMVGDELCGDLSGGRCYCCRWRGINRINVVDGVVNLYLEFGDKCYDIIDREEQ